MTKKTTVFHGGRVEAARLEHRMYRRFDMDMVTLEVQEPETELDWAPVERAYSFAGDDDDDDDDADEDDEDDEDDDEEEEEGEGEGEGQGEGE